MVRFELREYEEQHNEKYSKINELKCYLLRYTQIEIQCTLFSMRERETHTHSDLRSGDAKCLCKDSIHSC